MSDFDSEKMRIINALNDLRFIKGLSAPERQERKYREIGKAIVDLLNDGHFVHITPYWGGLQSPKRLEHHYDDEQTPDERGVGHSTGVIKDFKCVECGHSVEGFLCKPEDGAIQGHCPKCDRTKVFIRDREKRN